MLIDDSALTRLVVRRLLHTDKRIHVVASANDGSDAVANLAQAAPDLVIVDLEMPHLDGFGVLDELKNYPHIPTIVLSGASQEKLNKARAYGATVIAKPGGVATNLETSPEAGKLLDAVYKALRLNRPPK